MSEGHVDRKSFTLTGNVEEDCPITTFSEDKRYSSFFANGPIKFKYSTMQPLKTL